MLVKGKSPLWLTSSQLVAAIVQMQEVEVERAPIAMAPVWARAKNLPQLVKYRQFFDGALSFFCVCLDRIRCFYDHTSSSDLPREMLMVYLELQKQPELDLWKEGDLQ